MEQDRHVSGPAITRRRMLAAATGGIAAFATGAAAAQAPNATTQARNGAMKNANEEMVRSFDDQERIAALKRDVPALQRLWSEEFALNAPNNQVYIGSRAVLDTFVHTSVIDFSTFQRQVEFIRADGAFVFMMGSETVIPVSDAPSVGLVAGQAVNRRFTHVWKNEEDKWRLFVRHANVIPRR